MDKHCKDKRTFRKIEGIGNKNHRIMAIRIFRFYTKVGRGKQIGLLNYNIFQY
jgi:hypothetical protein